jgi:hypothetical protein
MKTINPFIHQSIDPSAASVRLFASAKSWIEGEAPRQLYAAARLEGTRLAIGFPDLHPGKGSPVTWEEWITLSIRDQDEAVPTVLRTGSCSPRTERAVGPPAMAALPPQRQMRLAQSGCPCHISS